MIASVRPLSRKAENRFANSMNGHHIVTIEQIKDGKVFFVSKHGYSTWAPFPSGPDWSITLNPLQPVQ